MLNLTKNISAVFAALLFTSPLATTANAQTITLGGNDEQIYNILRSNGYTQGTITKRKLTIVRTEACKGADKFLVKISILGRITSVAKIGTCPQNAQTRGFTREEAVNLLHRDGFTEIRAVRQGRRIAATACRQNRRYELDFNRRGQLTNRRDIGSCAAVGLSRAQIKDVMQTEGYSRIVVTDDELPKYVAEACRGDDKVRVSMNRRGKIRSERRIGDCARQFNPDNLATLMQDRGYNRIKIIDDRRPPFIVRACKGADRMEVSIGRYGRLRRQERLRACRPEMDPNTIANVLQRDGYDRVRVLRQNRRPYLAEACKGDSLIELTIGRYGRIQREERVGRCSQPITEVALKEKLATAGFLNVGLTRRGDGWRAEVCRNETKVAIRIDPYGDFIRERNVGACTSQTVLDVLKNLENRGAQQTSIQVLGCYRNTKYRWLFDRLGNRTGRERVGNC